VLRAVSVLALALACAAGCSKDDAGAPDASAPAAALAPVPAPAGLLAEVFAATPEATWTKARVLAGGSLFLPKGFGSLVVALTGLPITAAAEIDGDAPLVGALVEAAGQRRPRACLGVRVKAGHRFVDQLRLGPGARFTARVDAATGVAVLDVREGKPTYALGVLGGTLLVADSEASLLEVGPYVARTLPTAPMTKDELRVEVPKAALAGPVAKLAETAARALAAPPTDGGPLGATQVIQALLGAGGAAQSVANVLGDLEKATITVNMDNEATRLRLVMRPGSGPSGAAMKGLAFGDALPLLALPKDTLGAALVRESAGSRAASTEAGASDLAALLGAGTALPRQDLDRALGAVAKARGDWAAIGVALGPTGPAGYARAPLTGDDAFADATKALWALTQGKPVKAKLATAGVELARSKTVLENLPGDVERYRVAWKGAPDAMRDAATPTAVDVLVAVRDGELAAATGYESRDALRRLLAAKGAPGESLGGVDEVRAAIEALGSDVAIAIVGDPLAAIAARAGRAAPAAPAPVTLAIAKGPDAGSLLLRLDVATAAVREAAKVVAP
jgi:hypothetical protein